MRYSGWIWAAVLCLVCMAPPAPAAEPAAGDRQLGEQLVRQVWADMKNTDVERLDKIVAGGFQSVHGFGANDWPQELELIKGLKLGPYTLSGFKVTRNGPVIIATYMVSVDETIHGHRLHGKPAPRMSIFLLTQHGWKWIAHANLKRM